MHVRRNVNYENDVRRFTRLCHIVLSMIGIWPVDSKSRTKILLSRAFRVLSNLIFGFAILPCALYIKYDEKDTTIRLKLIGLLSFCTVSMIKYNILIFRVPKIKYCMDQMKRDWYQVEQEEDRKTMIKHATVSNSLMTLCVTFMYSGGIIYYCVRLFGSDIMDNNFNITIRPVIYPTYSAMYNTQMSPVYEMVVFGHCCCGFVMYSITPGACGLAALFVTHACGQAEILMAQVDDLIPNKRNNIYSSLNDRFKVIVEFHVEIIRFCTVVEEIFQEVCLIDLVGSTCMICLLEYYCLTDYENNDTVGLLTYGLLLVSLTFNIFIFCYIGELLMKETKKIGLKCYTTNWYDLPNQTARGLILMIAVSNNPAKISAGSMTDLSIHTFGKVLKTSVAYLSFLRTLLM